MRTGSRKRLFGTFRYAILLVWALISIFPVFWMASTSLKPNEEWFAWPAHFVPQRPTLNNYRIVWNPFGQEEGFGREKLQTSQVGSPLSAFGNSVIIAFTSTVLSVAVGFLLAYGVSRYRVMPEQRLFNLLILRMVPPIAIALPILIYYRWWEQGVGLRFLDTYHGLIILYVVTTLPYSTWMLKSFIDEVPIEVEQAAALMGASRLRTMGEVVFPLVRSGIVATLLFVLILTWSEYLLALTLGFGDISTLPIAMSRYEGATEGRIYGHQAALSVGVTIPLVIIGLLIHKHLVRGFSFGMMKR
ncbi:MAG: carbohydrate ABC transporter permease [Nitrospinota bacterium]